MCAGSEKGKKRREATWRAGSRRARTLDVRLDVEKAGKLRRQKEQKEERGSDSRRRGDEACTTTKRRSSVHDHKERRGGIKK